MTPLLRRPNSAALAFLLGGSFWFVVGTLYGLAAAIHLAAPEFFDGIPWLVFGRVRPTHVNTVLYGFVVSLLIGCGLYYVPALLKTRLWSERVAWLSWLLWNAAVLSGPITFGAGATQGREYCEYVWVADVLVMLAVLLLVLDVLMTIARRNENTLYVGVWYFAGAFLWMAGMYPVGNVMWRIPEGAIPGLGDSLLLWYYGHNLPGLLLTPLALGAAYFTIPRITKTPLYSHTLSLVGFWTLVALYSHIGGHHLLQAPIPNWLKTISVIDSVAMVIPVFTVLVNLWMTARGRMNRLWSSPAGLFIVTGTIWYLITCVQGTTQSIPAVQRVTHFNNWTVGHAHIAILGFAGYIALGTSWHVLPLAARKPLYSRRLVGIQFALITVGLVGFFVVLTAAGLIQGGAWNNGEVVYRVLPEISVYMILRAMLGITIVAAAFVGLYNLVRTLRDAQATGAVAPTTEGAAP